MGKDKDKDKKKDKDSDRDKKKEKDSDKDKMKEKDAKSQKSSRKQSSSEKSSQHGGKKDKKDPGKIKEERTAEQVKELEKTHKKPYIKPKNFSQQAHDAFTPYRIMLYIFGRFPITSKKKANGTHLYKCSLCSCCGLYFLIVSFVMVAILAAGSINLFVLLVRDTQNFTAVNVFGNNATENVTTTTTTTPTINISTLATKPTTPPKPTPKPCSVMTDCTCDLSECPGFGLGRERIPPRVCDVMMIRETALFKRHLVPFIIIWTSLALGVIGSGNLFFKRTYLVNFLNFWSRGVYILHMDVAKGLHSYCIIIGAIYLASVLALIFFGGLRIGSASTGAPTLLALLMLKSVRPLLLAPPACNRLEEVNSELKYFQIMAGVCLIYIYIASRTYIFMFIFYCKLLQNAFASWNGRVYAAVLRGGEYTQTLEGRTTYSLLFKDHCVLLDLLEGTDQFFTSIIESYYGLQVASICFEIFFLLRVAKEGGNQQNAFTAGFFVRPLEWAPALIILLQSGFLLWIVSRVAAAVGEEAIAGLEVIRRKTMLGRKTDEELYFTLSMYSSYTAHKKLEISGGGYFYLNKEFIIGVVSTVFSYFIIIYQFNPILDLELPGKGVDNASLQRRAHVGQFLYEVEKLPRDHWLEGVNSRNG